MKCLIVVSCLLALAAAKPGFYAGPYAGPYAAPYAAYAAPYAAHYGVASSVSSQYHAQDTLGQYSYGYSGGPSAKTETRTADGITRGGYSYIDGHGLVQSANYVADPVNGFRVAATNLPVGPSAPAAPVVHAAPVAVAHAAPLAYAAHGVPAVAAGVPLDTPEVAAAKAAHFQAHAEANARVFGRKKRSVGFAPAAVSYAAAPAFNYGYSTYAAHAAPVAVAHAAPYAVAAPAPVAVVEPVKSFGYSTVSAHAAPVAVAHAAPVAVAHAAPYAVAAPAPVAVVEPVKSFGYSTVSAHADPVVVASHAAPVAVAHAAPAVSYAAAPAAVSYAAAPAHFNYAPAHVSYAAPAVAVAPAVSGSSQYQAQDTLGQYSYGYADSNSQKHEARTADGITHGGYSYVDGHGLVQSASYVADAAGFRVAATNLPVGPAAP